MKRQFNEVIERDSEGWLIAGVPSLKLSLKNEAASPDLELGGLHEIAVES